MPENQRLNTINGTILIVDDDAGFLESIRRMLITNDCTNVLMLNDSRKVISELDRGGISVVLLDWIMPHVAERVVHPAHVPLQAEAEPALPGGA